MKTRLWQHTAIHLRVMSVGVSTPQTGLHESVYQRGKTNSIAPDPSRGKLDESSLATLLKKRQLIRIT